MPKEKKLRLWPAAIILFLAAIALAVIWNLPSSHQDRNLRALGTGFVVFALLLIWFVLLSRAPRGARFLVLGLVIGSIFVGWRFFEVRGVTGDLIPIISLRSKARPTLSVAHNSTVPSAITNGVEFPQFQGPNRNGVITGIELESNWESHPPKILWKQPIGAGWSGFVTSRGRAITQEQREALECVVCYDLLSGQTVWVHSDTARYATTIAGEGPRATPIISGNRVFTLGATGLLNCLDFESGKLIWQKNILKENNAEVPDWGLTGSPLVHDGKVIVNAGGAVRGSLCAYAIESGDLVWGAGSATADYSAPVLFNLLGQEQILIFNSNLFSHQVGDGKILWQYPWAGGNPRVSLPVAVSSNLVFISTGYGIGSELLKLEVDSEKKWNASRVWKSMALKSKFGPIFIYEDHIYGLDDGIFTCVELKTGQRKWKDGRYGHGQALLVKNLILLTAENGELILIQPNPEKLLEVSRLRVFAEKTWNPPALAGEYLLMRNDKEAACLKLSLVQAAEKKLALLFAKHILAN